MLLREAASRDGVSTTETMTTETGTKVQEAATKVKEAATKAANKAKEAATKAATKVEEEATKDPATETEAVTACTREDERDLVIPKELPTSSGMIASMMTSRVTPSLNRGGQSLRIGTSRRDSTMMEMIDSGSRMTEGSEKGC